MTLSCRAAMAVLGAGALLSGCHRKTPEDTAFHIAAPYPGTPFFDQVVKNGWFRAGVRWEEVDMDESTVLDYPELRAEELEYWQKRAFREWALRPGPILTYARMLLSDRRTFWSAVNVGLQHLGWTKRLAPAGAALAQPKRAGNAPA